MAEKKISKDNITKIILAPQITEKAVALEEKSQYIFRISQRANKTLIKQAIESLYNVKVKKVNIINIPAKKIRRGKQEGRKPGYKKAIIILKKGQKLKIHGKN